MKSALRIIALYVLTCSFMLGQVVLNNCAINNMVVTDLSPILGSMYVDMETGSSNDLLTSNAVFTTSHGMLGTVDITSNAANHAMISTNAVHLHSPVSVNGTTYRDLSGTRTFAFDLAYNNNYVQHTFTTFPTNTSIGCFIKSPGNNGSFATIDYIAIEFQYGGFFVAQSGSTDKLHAHGSLTGGDSGQGSDISWTPNTTYWLTMVCKANDLSTLNLYETSSWTLVGTSTFTPYAASGGACKYILWGRMDNHAQYPPAGTWCYYDNFVINTNGVFPLGP